MKKEIILHRTIAAPRERVWKAWTDPTEVAQWWGPDGVTIPTIEIDLREGGNLYIVMLAGEELGALAGQKWPMGGTFKEIVEPQKLVFSNNAFDEAGGVLLTGETAVTFEEENGATNVTVTTSAEGDAPGTDMMLAGMDAGWNQQLDKLVKFVA
jgi:uncharacterized protein YndB with AHSA1/START domain